MESEIMLPTIRPGDLMPSIFEILVVEKIDLTAAAVIGHTVNTVINQGYVNDIEAESMQSIVMIMLESVSFYLNDSSIVESVYGLKRISVFDGQLTKLSAHQRLVSYFFQVICPNLVKVLDKYSIRYSGQQRIDQTAESATLSNIRTESTPGIGWLKNYVLLMSQLGEKLSRGLRHANRTVAALIRKYSPVLKALWQIVVVAADNVRMSLFPLTCEHLIKWLLLCSFGILWQQILYSHDASPHINPVLAALNICLVRDSRLKSSKYSANSSSLNADEGRSKGVSSSSLQLATPSIPPLVPVGQETADSSSSSHSNWKSFAIMAFILSMKAASWVVSIRRSAGGPERFGRIRAPGGRNKKVPKPPKRPKTGEGCISPPEDETLCPLCRQPRQHPCASTGGFVFCYACIMEHLRGGDEGPPAPFCPVTGIPCSERDLFRIYEDHSVT